MIPLFDLTGFNMADWPPDRSAAPPQVRDFLDLRRRLRGGQVVRGGPGDVREVVAGIIAGIAAGGERSLLEATARYDKVSIVPSRLRVSGEDLDRARREAQGDFIELVRRAASNIRAYQEQIKIQAPREMRRGGRRLGVRYTSCARVGVYVPGGRAFYPSTVLMTVVPAQVAGVGQIAIASPPGPDGEVNMMVLAIAAELGVREVYRMGGAQAVAALALGAGQVKPVDKIVGPGNAFVAEAKRQLAGVVGIDSIAGPSEVLIIADRTADASWLAADMMAQAEHDPGSAILVTPSIELAEEVMAALGRQIGPLERSAAIAASLEGNSAIVLVPDTGAAVALANDMAPEHLQIVTGDDEAVLAGVRNAGAIFVGPYTPVSLGDYFAGPSHVLPTGSTARFFSALSCNDFLKASSVVRYDRRSLEEDARSVMDFASREALTAHANAVRVRIEPPPERERK